jgi:aspartyl-tRNA(Asn)/glutamyl-tRNA(Gln) amidotransferase subunit C
MDRKTVRMVAQVARLDISEREAGMFSRDLSSMLDAFRDLAKADTKGVPPSFQPIDTKNVTRPDRVEPGLSQEEALANADNKEEGHFKAPKVV